MQSANLMTLGEALTLTTQMYVALSRRWRYVQVLDAT